MRTKYFACATRVERYIIDAVQVWYKISNDRQDYCTISMKIYDSSAGGWRWNFNRPACCRIVHGMFSDRGRLIFIMYVTACLGWPIRNAIMHADCTQRKRSAWDGLKRKGYGRSLRKIFSLSWIVRSTVHENSCDSFIRPNLNPSSRSVNPDLWCPTTCSSRRTNDFPSISDSFSFLQCGSLYIIAPYKLASGINLLLKLIATEKVLETCPLEENFFL